MRKTIEYGWHPMGHRDVWIVTCRRKHRKCLNVNIWNVLFARQRMRADYMGKRMKNQISVLTSFFCLAPDICTNLDCMIHQFLEQSDKIMARLIQAAAQVLWIATQRQEINPLFFNKTLESRWCCQFDRMTFFHKPER